MRGRREVGVVGSNGDMWYDLAAFSSSTQGWLKVSADDYKWTLEGEGGDLSVAKNSNAPRMTLTLSYVMSCQEVKAKAGAERVGLAFYLQVDRKIPPPRCL